MMKKRGILSQVNRWDGREGVAVVSKRWFGWLMLFSAKCTLYHGRGRGGRLFFLCF